jgi:hypothetical protein
MQSYKDGRKISLRQARIIMWRKIIAYVIALSIVISASLFLIYACVELIKYFWYL